MEELDGTDPFGCILEASMGLPTADSAGDAGPPLGGDVIPSEAIPVAPNGAPYRGVADGVAVAPDETSPAYPDPIVFDGVELAVAAAIGDVPEAAASDGEYRSPTMPLDKSEAGADGAPPGAAFDRASAV